MAQWRGSHREQYYNSNTTATAAFFNQAVRKYWCIETAASCVLDIIFREDNSRSRRDNSAENFAVATHRTQPYQAGQIF